MRTTAVILALLIFSAVISSKIAKLVRLYGDDERPEPVLPLLGVVSPLRNQ